MFPLEKAEPKYGHQNGQSARENEQDGYHHKQLNNSNEWREKTLKLL